MISVNCRYHHVLTLYRNDGSPVGHTPFRADWHPAWYWTAFQGLRRGVFAEAEPGGRATVEPIWHREAHEPHLSGFSITLAADGADGPSVTCDLPLTYFKPLAVTASGYYVEKGLLKERERFLFGVTAFLSEHEEAGTPASPFTVEEVRQPLTLKEGAMADYIGESMLVGDAPTDEVPAAFIPQHVLDEAADLARAAGASETGGILIGHLVRDTSPDSPDVFVEVTSQIHARHAVGATTRLTFTPETWEAVQAALDLRGQGEIWLGWWHSHPKAVSEEVACEVTAFMSPDDCALHRACFPRAYSVALVVTEDPRSGELSHTLFGWWCGLIAARGFHVLGAPRAEATMEAAVSGGARDAH